MVVKPDKLSLLFVTATIVSGITLTIPLMASYSAQGLHALKHIPLHALKHIRANDCENSVNVIDVLNPASGNTCTNS
jgi:hypothetical protein